MYQENNKQANRLMRKAVPLMLKLDIAPTPYNYGVWYEYVSNRNQKLNQLMDSTLRNFGSFPNYVAKELFHDFLLSDEFSYQKEHQNRLETMTADIGESSHTMNKEIQQLTKTLHKSRHALQHNQQPNQVEKIIKYLEKGTQKANKAAQSFSHSLQHVQKELDKLNKELQEMKKNTELDQLTLLANFRGLERHLFDSIPQAEEDLSLLIVDIDNLALVNKEYGKRAGNALIRFVADTMKAALPEAAFIARLQGGRFAILLNEMELKHATLVANQIKDKVAVQKIRYKQTKALLKPVTVSIGVATIFGEETSQELMARAEGNLKMAKASGKNCVSTHGLSS